MIKTSTKHILISSWIHKKGGSRPYITGSEGGWSALPHVDVLHLHGGTKDAVP